MVFAGQRLGILHWQECVGVHIMQLGEHQFCTPSLEQGSGRNSPWLCSQGRANADCLRDSYGGFSALVLQLEGWIPRAIARLQCQRGENHKDESSVLGQSDSTFILAREGSGSTLGLDYTAMS